MSHGPPCDAHWLDATALAALSDSEWADLANNASTPNPFYEHWYLRPALTHLAGDTIVRVLTVRIAGQLIALAPFVRARRYGRMPLANTQNWLHYHCFFGAPLVRSGFETAFWQSCFSAIDGVPWRGNFLHLVGLEPGSALLSALQATRRTDVVHRETRALLASALAPGAYYEHSVRKKKRKEIDRLRNRLRETGPIAFARLSQDAPVGDWTRDFLALEASGWKGRAGTALAAASDTRTFLTDAISGAHDAGRLEMIRMTVGERTVAMLINFLTPPGSFAFKIAYDESFARYSPGVMVQIENLALLDRTDIDWMDSCAVEDHPMINGLWMERRAIVRVTVPLSGKRRSAMFHAARTAEDVAARLRGRR